MAEYYLVSQLPSLDIVDDNMPLPIDEKRFLELCCSFLKKKAYSEIEKLTLVPQLESRKSYSSLLDNWYEGERNLRLALAKARAEKMNKSFEVTEASFSDELISLAGEAVRMENPLEAEKFLLNYRLKFLESLRPSDTFAEDFLFYYGLKLKLITRMRQFDKKLGEEAYRNIYNSILGGERMEGKK